uniref:Purinergic receptor P2X, ligand-gated ion channel, 4b n=1 Tax=Seriola lalandi dorsalis TaxID=1841481 RepID=A0A3B4XJP7_SERLL
MSTSAGCCQSCLHYVFDYETTKTLVIPSIRLGCAFRFTQLLVVLYVVGYVCVVQKAYQETDSVISSVTTKVKGFALTNTSDMDPRFWDVADYVIPPQGDHSFFVMTNMVVTPEQTQTRCAEVRHRSICTDDCDCTDGHSDPRGNGIQSGLCVNYSSTVQTCQVLSWCPLEIDTELPQHALLAAAENFTVLIKNSVTYPKFNFHRRNILPHINSSYLKRCQFSRATDPDCPIFRLKDIVSEAGEEFQDMAVKVQPQLNITTTFQDVHYSLSFLSLVSRHVQSCNMEKKHTHKFSDDRQNLSVLIILPQVPVVSDWIMLTCTKKKDLYGKLKATYLSEDAEAEAVSD